jgi:hypothetical protein
MLFVVTFVFSVLAQAQVLPDVQRVALNQFFDAIGCFDPSICPRIKTGQGCPFAVSNMDAFYCDSDGSISDVVLDNFLQPNSSHTSTISSVIGRLTNLKRLLLGNDPASTERPQSYGKGRIIGTVPTQLMQCTLLERLDLVNNRISGTLNFLTALRRLTAFFGGENNFTGVVPDLTGLTSLQAFNVQKNRLTGTPPSLPSSLSGSTCNLQGGTSETNCIVCDGRTRCGCMSRTCPTTTTTTTTRTTTTTTTTARATVAAKITTTTTMPSAFTPSSTTTTTLTAVSASVAPTSTTDTATDSPAPASGPVSPTDPDNTGIIVGAVLGAVMLIGVTATAVVVWRKRSKAPAGPKSGPPTSAIYSPVPAQNYAVGQLRPFE